jgi:HSP20 family protein
MLVRYDPFRELDRMTDQLFGGGTQAGRMQWMPMDAVRHDQQVELRFDLPGVATDSIDVTIERNVLTVRAERSWTPSEGEEILAQERPQGAVTRQVMLGEALDADRLQANYEAGVLILTIPVAEQAKPRKVEIQTGGNDREALEVGASN